MSQITKDDVLKLARLSRLSLTDSEVELYQMELGDIFAYVEKLGEVDTSGVEPTYQVNYLQNITRHDDIVDYGTTKESLMKNAPSTEDGMFKVRRMVG
jgi:aspartyl-tRNA(Asn)/glutamyl-tRNA(Gln) amidotransferase subunit C